MARSTTVADLLEQLNAELERLRAADPFAALGLKTDATVADVRNSFLNLVKKYHPNRFARVDAGTKTAATEAFLLIQESYHKISNEEQIAKWREKLSPSRSKVKETGRPVARQTKPPAGNAKQQMPATAKKPARPQSRLRTPTTTRPAAIGKARAAAGPGTAPNTGAENLKTKVPSTHPGSRGKELLEEVKKRGDRFEEAKRLLRAQKASAARKEFQALASDDPQSKPYRAHLSYSIALEHKQAQRYEEAEREVQRALVLLPDFELAQGLLDEIHQKHKAGGFFSRILGKK